MLVEAVHVEAVHEGVKFGAHFAGEHLSAKSLRGNDFVVGGDEQ